MTEANVSDPPGLRRVFRLPTVLIVQRALLAPLCVVFLVWVLYFFGRSFTGRARQMVAIVGVLAGLCGTLLESWLFWHGPRTLETKDGVLIANFFGGRSASWPLTTLRRRSTWLARLMESEEIVNEVGERLFFLSRRLSDVNVLNVMLGADPVGPA